MRPFQEFRFWARRAPTGERISAGVGALLVAILVAWLLVPGSGPKSTNLASSGGGLADQAGTGAQTNGAPGAPGVGPGAGAPLGVRACTTVGVIVVVVLTGDWASHPGTIAETEGDEPAAATSGGAGADGTSARRSSSIAAMLA